jgi:hypothetical protein
MVVTVMNSAQRYGELIADLEPHRAGLGEPQMVGVGRASSTDQTGLRGNELDNLDLLRTTRCAHDQPRAIGEYADGVACGQLDLHVAGTKRTHRRCDEISALGGIVLQNSKNGFQRFFREKSNQAIIADRCILKRATEVAGEFITCCCGPPARLFDRRAHSPENLSSVIPKEFCNTIGGKADLVIAHTEVQKWTQFRNWCPADPYSKSFSTPYQNTPSSSYDPSDASNEDEAFHET